MKSIVPVHIGVRGRIRKRVAEDPFWYRRMVCENVFLKQLSFIRRRLADRVLQLVTEASLLRRSQNVGRVVAAAGVHVGHDALYRNHIGRGVRVAPHLS